MKEMYSLTLLRFQSPKLVLLGRNLAPSSGLGVNGCFVPPASRGFGTLWLMVASLQSLPRGHIASFVCVSVCVCVCVCVQREGLHIRTRVCVDPPSASLLQGNMTTSKAHWAIQNNLSISISLN